MRNLFYIIAFPVSPVIHGINTPCRARSVVRDMQNAIHNGITHQHVRVFHVYFCSQNMCSFFVLSVSHLIKQIEVLFGCSLAVRTVYSWLCWCSFLLSHLRARLGIYIGLAVLNHKNGPIKELFKII